MVMARTSDLQQLWLDLLCQGHLALLGKSLLLSCIISFSSGVPGLYLAFLLIETPFLFFFLKKKENFKTTI